MSPSFSVSILDCGRPILPSRSGTRGTPLPRPRPWSIFIREKRHVNPSPSGFRVLSRVEISANSYLVTSPTQSVFRPPTLVHAPESPQVPLRSVLSLGGYPSPVQSPDVSGVFAPIHFLWVGLDRSPVGCGSGPTVPVWDRLPLPPLRMDGGSGLRVQVHVLVVTSLVLVFTHSCVGLGD